MVDKFDQNAVNTAQEDSNIHDQILPQRRLITAALPYINNVPHLGHIVGSHLPADIFARYSRMKGFETTLIGGSDEFGSPSEIAAEQLGIEHREFCDTLHEIHKQIYEWFGISYDNYSRTSSPKHQEIVHDLFNKIREAGYINQKTVEMFYDVEAERFLADRFVEGTCGNCNFEGASGDQCECCTKLLDTKELINPKSKLTGTTPELKESEHLFFDLDKFEDSLKDWVSSKSNWRPQVKNLALGWLELGLKSRCITRDLKHGIPVPLDEMEAKKLYVWFEAPITYMSFLAEVDENWEEIWSNEDGEANADIYHFLGKDNIPFHTIFWPAIIMGAGKYKLPDHVEGVQYLNYEGEKFSKSKGVGIFCEAFLDSDVNPDLFRSYLTTVIPEKGDTEFRWSDFQVNSNKMLTDILSNFIHRSSAFNFSKFDGEVQKPSETQLQDDDKKVLEIVAEKLKQYEANMDSIQIRNASKTIFEIASAGNKYLQETAPWKAVKEQPERAKHIIYICAYISKVLATVLAPFLPDAASRIWDQFNFEGDENSVKSWQQVGDFNSMPLVVKINEPKKLFLKISNDEIEEIRSKLSKTIDLKDFFK